VHVLAPAVELVLDGGSEDVPRSRAFTRESLFGSPDELADAAALVVTELVTNALLHGSPPVRVRLREVPDGVRLEVADRGAELPVAVRRSSAAMTGRGLALVEALCRSWGVDADDLAGKVVWAELAEDVAGGLAAVLRVDLVQRLEDPTGDDEVEPLHTVELDAVPTNLLLDAKAHVDDLVREFALEAAAADETAAASGSSTPAELAQLVATVVHGFRGPRNAIERQALEAAERDEPEVHLTLTLPASAAEAGERYLAALDEADGWAARARLLTLETPPVQKVFRHWYVQALVDQLRALTDGTAPPPIVPFPQRLAATLGAPATPVVRRSSLAPGVDHAALFRALPTPYMVMDRDLVLVDCNDAYLATVGRTREEIVGHPVFEVFPPTPDALDESGVPRVQRSFERARDTGSIDTMPLQRYDIPDPATGGLTQRYWSLISVPIRDPQGRVVLVAQRAEDITDFVAERDRSQAERQRTAELGRRVLEVEGDLFARAQELAAAVADKERAAERVAALAGVALELTRADDVRDLTSTVIERGLPVLGADGGAVAVRSDDDTLRLLASRSLGEQVQAAYGELPMDSALPAAVVARTGQTVLLPTRAAGLAWSPDMAAVYEATQRSAWATLPLRVGSELLGSLIACWEQERAFAEEDVALLEGFAAQVSQAVLRIRATQAQRAAALAAQRMSETLQLSLLTDPPHVPGLQIAVRYQPAAQEAQIGGDWYDAFVTAAGSTLVVIGDIGGHDRTAAARMGQVRNLLRGMAYDSDDSPAVLLGRLDTAMQGLGLETLATALLARVEPADDGYRLRWANAGHLPPVLRTGKGGLHVLDDESDLLLGLDAHAERRERTTDLPTGSTLVLYTDGLIERRDASLDAGIARVTQAVSRLGDAGAEATADAVVTAAGSSNEDDIAVLVLKVGPDAGA
jgi:PAS domain S-box-containing protein